MGAPVLPDALKVGSCQEAPPCAREHVTGAAAEESWALTNGAPLCLSSSPQA